MFTVEEAQAHTRHIPGGHCKNLFLKDKKDRLWLVTCLDEQQVDLNRLSKLLGAARFSFGRAELLQEVLGVTPGSVTPLAIVNDRGPPGHPVLDTKLLAHDWVNCHPLRERRHRPRCAAPTCCASSATPATSRCSSTSIRRIGRSVRLRRRSSRSSP